MDEAKERERKNEMAPKEGQDHFVGILKRRLFLAILFFTVGIKKLNKCRTNGAYPDCG